MNLLFMFLLVILFLCLIITLMLMFISKKSLLDTQKSTPFECGFNPMSMKRMPFSIHFFLIAVIFLIFDIEIIIIFPLVLIMKFSLILNWLVSSIMFLLILILGLYHEWTNGMLNWAK
nr:NADH dehydrogenase subunit 3 [Jacobiasca formosana]UER93873.1 NADH dehydrogenase subunit 3 [Jacobiasca formosana]